MRVLPPKVLVQACTEVKSHYSVTLAVERGVGNWCVRIGMGGLIFSDQFLEGCQFTIKDFVNMIEKEVVFRGASR